MVTGAAGFIGARLSRVLEHRGYEVLGVDNLSLGRKEALPASGRFMEVDVSNLDEISQTMSGYPIDVIFHLAGQSGGELSFSETLFDCDSNVRSTIALLEFAKLHGVSKFVHASSAAVYGDQPAKPSGLTESDGKTPLSPYGVSKLAAESYLGVLSSRFAITSTSLRFFNVYGQGQDLERLNQGMLSIYLAQAIKSKNVIVKGSSERYRDFVHVDDAVEACVRAMRLVHDGHKSLNVCTGQRTYVWQALEVIQEMFGHNVSIEFEAPTPGDVAGWVGNPTQARRELGWSPKIAFDEGFREMVSLEMQRFL